MTARAPRQERAEQRRAILVRAAAALVAEHGPGAFSARAVATGAGLPLASVSYYFPVTDDLLDEAIAVVVRGWLSKARQYAATEHGRGPRAAAEALATTILPPGPPAVVLTRYQHLLAAGHRPVTAAALARLQPELAALVTEVLAATGVTTAVSSDVLIAVIDGAAIGALSENADDPRGTVRDAVLEILTRC